MTRYSYILSIALAWTVATTAQETLRQRAYYPTGVPMEDETVEWKQDVYRELSLLEPANAGLFSPADQLDKPQGLFAHIFDMAVKRIIHLYKYEIDGNEKLIPRNEMGIKNFLDDYHIAYTADSTGRLTFNKNDIPYAEVTTFYIKEAVYYDAVNSSFRTKVIALCPVLVMEDEFNDQPVRYPLFWVKYQEMERYMQHVIFRPEIRNLAVRMTMDDFFTLNRYKGDIYKVYNPHATTLSQYCKNDTVMQEEQQRIERNLQEVRRRVYNIYHREKKEDKLQNNAQQEEKPKKKKEHKAKQEAEAIKDDSPAEQTPENEDDKGKIQK